MEEDDKKSSTEDIEKRVDEMMAAPAPEKKSPKSITIKLDEESIAELKPQKPKKISVVHHDPEPEPIIEEPEVEIIVSHEPVEEDMEVSDVLEESVPDKDVVSGSTDKPEEEAAPEESAEPESSDQPVEETPIDETINDTSVDDVVDEIVAQESDDLLAAQDGKFSDGQQSEPKPHKRHRIRGFFAAWWRNPWVRWTTVFVILASCIAAALIPGSRYYVLNSFGVRASASLTILDDSSQQPLKNVQVSMSGRTAETDRAGNVTLSGLKLGKTELVIEKVAFAVTRQQRIVGWGSNPLGNIKLTPKGSQFTLSAVDFLSGKPVSKVEATNGEASAISDEKGAIKITIDQPSDTVEVSIKAEGYRDETVSFKSTKKDTLSVKLVPARKHVFVSKRTGKYDVYKVDVDGKNEKLILAGTGNERDDIVIAPHPTSDLVAVVSSRDNQRNKDGYLLSTLTMVNLGDDTAYKLAQSERVQIIDWVNGRLLYVQIAAGASAANPKRYRLMSYDPSQKASKEIAASNYFNDVLVAKNKVYFAPSSVYVGGSPAGLYRVDGDGSNKQTIMADETWNAFRISYDHIVLSLQQKWYDYKIGDAAPVKLDGSPANLTNRVYFDSPDGKRSLWVDSRDGKGVLVAYDISSQKETTLRSQNGLKTPIRWLNSHTVVYRITTDQETADYVYNLDGGEPNKIRDVTNTGGIDKWYYY